MERWFLLPESHAQCVLIQTGTPDSQVRFGQKGCISKIVAEKDAFIRGPLRGLYAVSLYGLSTDYENISSTDSFSQRNSG